MNNSFIDLRSNINNKIINSLSFYADYHYYFCGGGYGAWVFMKDAMYE
jgi:hypothetical protein